MSDGIKAYTTYLTGGTNCKIGHPEMKPSATAASQTLPRRPFKGQLVENCEPSAISTAIMGYRPEKVSYRDTPEIAASSLRW